MAYRLSSSGAVIEPASAILSIHFVLGLTPSELVSRNADRVGHHLVSDDRIPPPDCHGNAVIALSFSHPPRLGEHFVLGSDDATTDISIGIPGDHVSAQHLRFGFDEQDRVIMLDCSTLGTRVAYNHQPFHLRRGRPGRPFRWVLPAGHHIRVQTGPFLFTIFVEDHSFHAEHFRANLERFHHDCRSRLPELSNINLAANPPATAGNMTPAADEVRPGASSLTASAVITSLAVPEEDTLDNEMYVEGRILGHGGNGTVNEFHAVGNWARYAGKRVAHYQNMLDEIEMLKKLIHVCAPRSLIPPARLGSYSSH